MSLLLGSTVALAGPVEAERLKQAARAMRDQSYPQAELRYEGHGPRLGHVVVQPLQVEAGPSCVRWKGEGLDQQVFFGHGVWSGPTWEPVDDPERERLIRWASRPSLLLAWLAASPERLVASDSAVLWGFEEGLARIQLADDGTAQSLTWESLHPVFGPVTQGIRWTPDRMELELVEADSRWSVHARRGPIEPVTCDDPPARIQVEPLGDGLYALGVPEADARVLIVVRGREGVLFDAPLSSAIGQALWTEANRLAPDVRRWSVVVSHHHPHYTGGLRPWVDHGARLYVHSALEAWIRTLLTAPRPDAPSRAPKIQPVTDGSTLLDGRVELRTIDAASGHTDAFVIARIGGELVYVADLARQTPTGEVRHRGTWPTEVAAWASARVFSGFPLSGPAVFPFPEP